MPYFDAHCHAAAEQAADRAAAGSDDGAEDLAGRIVCGTSPADWEVVRALCRERENRAVPAYGLHPWETPGVAAGWADDLERRLAAEPAAWLGEAGLDRARADRIEMAVQLEALSRQLVLARRLDRPVSLHCVRAWGDLLPLLDACYGGGRLFVMHAFSGPESYIRALSARGAFFSIGPAVLDRSFRRRRESAVGVPLERLLIESDCYVHDPGDGVGELRSVAAALAELRGIDEDEFAGIIAANARRVMDRGR